MNTARLPARYHCEPLALLAALSPHNQSDCRPAGNRWIQEKKLTEYQAKTLCFSDSNPLVMGEYVILDEIGRGGMGRVYKAFHRRMERTVALKTIQVFGDVAKAVERFRREVKAAAKLTHPNIVAALDAGERNDTPYLVMEYVEGETLARAARRHGGLPVLQAVDYILQAARGIEYAHRLGIVHRDIKPSNLMLARDGTVKVLDLGLARFENGNTDGGNGAEDTDLTGAGDFVGTANYVSPEAAVNTTVDFRTDIYSLGCTLHFLLTARPLYDSKVVLDKLFAHRNKPAPSLCAAVPGIPPLLDEIFQKMVAKNPADRYQSMSDVVSMLEGARDELETFAQRLVDEPTATMTLNRLPGTAAKPIRRGVVAVVLLLLAVTGWWLFTILFRLETPAGTLIVEVSEPGATITLLDEEGGVEIRRQADDTRLKVNVDVGRKELCVEKDGFQFYTTRLDVGTADGNLLHVELQPLVEQPPAAGPAKAEVATSETQSQQRELALWVLGRGGTLNVITTGDKSAGQARKAKEYQTTINRIADLPTTNYRVWRVSLVQRTDFDDEDLARLAQLHRSAKSISNLNLSGTRVTSEGLAHLEAFHDTLVELDLHATAAASDASVPHLSQCSRLRTLFLIAPAVGVNDLGGQAEMSLQGVQQLKQALPLCQVVWHPHRAVGVVLSLGGALTVRSDSGTRLVSRVTDLPQSEFSVVGINLAGTKTNFQLRDLLGLKELETLNLSGSRVQDANLVLLKRWASLKDLDLSATEITDEALSTLKSLTNLERLRLVDTRISADGIGELQSSLSGCEVETIAIKPTE